jgi:hypothetical protein
MEVFIREMGAPVTTPYQEQKSVSALVVLIL